MKTDNGYKPSLTLSPILLQRSLNFTYKYILGREQSLRNLQIDQSLNEIKGVGGSLDADDVGGSEEPEEQIVEVFEFLLLDDEREQARLSDLQPRTEDSQ